jgi:hypothetical protein
LKIRGLNDLVAAADFPPAGGKSAHSSCLTDAKQGGWKINIQGARGERRRFGRERPELR